MATNDRRRDEEDLKATSDSVARAAERIASLEREKAGLVVDGPRVADLSAEIERLAATMHQGDRSRAGDRGRPCEPGERALMGGRRSKRPSQPGRSAITSASPARRAAIGRRESAGPDGAPGPHGEPRLPRPWRREAGRRPPDALPPGSASTGWASIEDRRCRDVRDPPFDQTGWWIAEYPMNGVRRGDVGSRVIGHEHELIGVVWERSVLVVRPGRHDIERSRPNLFGTPSSFPTTFCYSPCLELLERPSRSRSGLASPMVIVRYIVCRIGGDAAERPLALPRPPLSTPRGLVQAETRSRADSGRSRRPFPHTRIRGEAHELCR